MISQKKMLGYCTKIGSNPNLECSSNRQLYHDCYLLPVTCYTLKLFHFLSKTFRLGMCTRGGDMTNYPPHQLSL